MASPEAKNLEAISKAIDQHNSSCPFPAGEVRMNPFEIERLGWEQIRGVLPIVPDPRSARDGFRIVCSRDVDGESCGEVEAVGQSCRPSPGGSGQQLTQTRLDSEVETQARSSQFGRRC